VERQPRLGGAEGLGQIADAPLALPEQVNDLEARRVRQCVKRLSGLVEFQYGCHGRKINHS
jgi:hypothetical protein